MLDPARLAGLFSAFPERPVMHCGSGVTACINVLAMEEAGLPLPPLYVGSWSDWISYPENPVATGND
jgi:thiosulfate/3-mercaptopyruvate sulfurtransferase